jgi:ABC-type branched-subunit amino acid transport system substrate-binding protein
VVLKSFLVHIFALFCVVCLAATSVLAGDQDRVILLGQSSALSGPAKNLGIELRAGFLAAFSRINDQGGVRGREIRLISRDDGYEPDRAIRNVSELIEDDQVFMLVGEVGTPTAKAIVPIIEKRRIPLFAPFTGAEFLRSPARKYVINVRASYFQEMERLAAYLVDERKLKRIACFYQNDSYGFSGLAGIKKALERRGMMLVSQGSYERNTVAVMGAVTDIFQEKPDAVILVGAYAACAEFIKLSKTKYADQVIFGNISFVGTESLQKALGAYGKDVIVSQVVPFPRDRSIPLISEFIESMQKYQHDAPISFITLEGYIGGKLFAEIAARVEGDLTGENFIHTMRTTGRFDLGGIVLEFDEDDHQGMDSVYLTTIYPEIRLLQSD